MPNPMELDFHGKVKLKPGWTKIKSFRKGYEAGKKGLPATACPYDVDDETKKILLKRYRWMLGWEEYTFGEKARAKRLKEMNKESRRKKKKHGTGTGQDIATAKKRKKRV